MGMMDIWRDYREGEALELQWDSLEKALGR